MRDREVIVAGGTGGIGAAVTELLASDGARLVIAYRNRADRAASFAKFGKVLQADITRAEDRERLLDAAPAMYGLVVLAGDPARFASPEQVEETMEWSHAENYLGAILLAREAAARMTAQQCAGAIVLFGTMQAMAPFPASTAYAGAKASLVHTARILAKECRGPANIRVNVVCPGVIAVGMAEASIASGKYDRYVSEGVVSRFGRAVDVARAVRFFLQPDNYITGQVLLVDGGLTL